MNPWVYLFFAGLGEVLWVISLKFSEGFSKLLPSALTVIFMIISLVLLSYSIKEIPMGTAYACWTAIGAIGAVIIGMIFFNESTDFIRIFFLSLLVISIVGLKLTTN